MADDLQTQALDEIAGARLTIHLDPLAANHATLRRQAGGAAVAGVVKANAYGLGLEPVARTLWCEGCRSFFVAMPLEGVALRALLPEAEIFVLSGLFGEAALRLCRNAGLVPVLASANEVEAARGLDMPFGLHVDTGMNRQGLAAANLRPAAEALGTPTLVMSHLACADDPVHPMNALQLRRFTVATASFSGVRRSLANSGGTFLGSDYAFDMVRPGIALYGGAPTSVADNPMQAVATAEARIVQLRRLALGDTVSYGATFTAQRDMLIAIATVGYADGYHRAGSGSGVPLRTAEAQGAIGFIGGAKAPVVGRITMDLTMFDVTACARDVAIGDWIELFGSSLPVDAAARAAGTISYELLTSLGARFVRRTVGQAI